MTFATVLYEDKRGPTKEFALHQFIVGCVHDEVNGDRWGLERAITGIPTNGAGNLLQRCREEVVGIAPDGHPVFALFDEDRIRRQLGLPAKATERQVVEKIKEGASAPEQLTIVLLVKNLESVLRAVADCDETLRAQALAAADKDRLLRDAVLSRVAFRPDRAVRDCVLSLVPALRVLRDAIAAAVRGRRAPPGA